MELRNTVTIAHVDHGKTTLVDEMPRQSGESEIIKKSLIEQWTTMLLSENGVSLYLPQHP